MKKNSFFISYSMYVWAVKAIAPGWVSKGHLIANWLQAAGFSVGVAHGVSFL